MAQDVTGSVSETMCYQYLSEHTK